jgi:hypothetical protein
MKRTTNQMNKSRIIVAATFDSPVAAEFAKARLEAEGIRATLQGQHHVAMHWSINNAVGGVKLLVWEEDVQRAREILELKCPNLEHNGQDTSKVPQCPKCASTDVFYERWNRKMVFLSYLFLFLPLPFFKRKLVCDSCKAQWSAKSQG